jgi:hypothetical protein
MKLPYTLANYWQVVTIFYASLIALWAKLSYFNWLRGYLVNFYVQIVRQLLSSLVILTIGVFSIGVSYLILYSCSYLSVLMRWHYF